MQKTAGSYAFRQTDVGPITIAVNDDAVSGLLFGRAGVPDMVRNDAEPLLVEACRQLEAWLEGRLRTFSLPLAPVSSSFGRSVREALLDIPYGRTATYGEVAVALGIHGAARAVGSACARNPLPLIVPCHRVVRNDGASGGYLGGSRLKAALLELERRNSA